MSFKNYEKPNGLFRRPSLATLTKISHNISYMKISYMKSLYGIETNFIYEMLCENFIYEIFIYEIVSIPHKDFIYEIFHI